MGILVTGSFTSAEGIPYSSLYVKLHTVSCEFTDASPENMTVSAHFLAFLNRDRRLLGLQYAIPAPPVPLQIGIRISNAELKDTLFPILYSAYRESLSLLGVSTEDVNEASLPSSESTQTTLPTPPPPSESVPEPQPEPQPQPSSEYVPSPEATEA